MSKIISQVLVEAKGGYPGKFINDVIHRGINIWDIKLSAGSVHFKMLPQQYASLKPLARKNQCRIKVTNKNGLLFLIAKYKNLIPFIVMVCLFLAMMAYCGTKVVDITISGNIVVSDAEINEHLNLIGIKFFSERKSLDVAETENYLMQRISDLSWVSINTSYGRVLVEVNEKKNAPISEYTSKNKYAESNCNGVISSVELKSGESLVSVGDTVSAGQIIAVSTPASGEHSWVSGINGEILGIVSENVSKTYEEIITVRNYTGRTKRYPVWDNHNHANLANRAGYKYYDCYIKSMLISVFGVTFPYSLDILTVQEVSQQNSCRSFREIESLYAEFTADYEASCGGRILSKTTNCEITGGCITFTTSYMIEKNLISLG